MRQKEFSHFTSAISKSWNKGKLSVQSWTQRRLLTVVNCWALCSCKHWWRWKEPAHNLFLERVCCKNPTSPSDLDKILRCTPCLLMIKSEADTPHPHSESKMISYIVCPCRTNACWLDFGSAFLLSPDPQTLACPQPEPTDNSSWAQAGLRDLPSQPHRVLPTFVNASL